ncbi:hypothetical protein [Flexivirga caeni]|uniref:hypothetical protein n=1 Tax=Flexivirga caeni TaxID=2294115 RepID=UPI001315A422|nr:hypothetical protein [Flexivirga caeni]
MKMRATAGSRWVGRSSETIPTIADPIGPVSGMDAPSRIEVNETLALPDASAVDRIVVANIASRARITTADTEKCRAGVTANAPRQPTTSTPTTLRVTTQDRDM